MMNKNDARKIAQTITNEQLAEMFTKAKSEITDWGKVSLVNKRMTKGVAWNILAKDFDLTVNYHILAKTNMVREFGKYLPEQLKPMKKKRSIHPSPTHQDPIFGIDDTDFN